MSTAVSGEMLVTAESPSAARCGMLHRLVRSWFWPRQARTPRAHSFRSAIRPSADGDRESRHSRRRGAAAAPRAGQRETARSDRPRPSPLRQRRTAARPAARREAGGRRSAQRASDTSSASAAPITQQHHQRVVVGAADDVDQHQRVQADGQRAAITGSRAEPRGRMPSGAPRPEAASGRHRLQDPERGRHRSFASGRSRA